MKNTKTKKEVKSHLTMLLQNKGYTLVHKSQQGNDIYLAIEPETGNVCIITANEGSQYFKEIILPEEVTDRLFSIIYKDYEVQPTKEIEGTDTVKCFKKYEDFDLVSKSERKINDVVITNEGLIRNIVDDQVISFANISHVNNILTNINIINLSYEEVLSITNYLIELAKDIKENIENSVKEEK